ncbi:MAG: hypothetical protein WB612_09705, partial [Nitrososphaeraceae archaeon]
MDTDASGNVYVADRYNNRVQEFSPNGTYITSWGVVGSENGQFKIPLGVAIDGHSGNVYVADSGNNRIQEFSPNGTYITSWGTEGSENGQFGLPAG